jgi:vitamin B12 transporter
VLAKLEINANYTFTELRDKVAVRIPKHKANMTVVYKVLNGLQLSTSYQYTGTRTDLVSGNKVSLNPYRLWDFTSRYLIPNSSILLHMSIHNILDEQYEEIKGFTTLGRNLRVGVEIPF